MNNLELQNRYYDSIVENFSLHCIDGGDYDGFKNLINCENCFQKTDNLIIDKISVTWCFHRCILNYWSIKLISDLLLQVDVEDLILNKYDLHDIDNNIMKYYYFENYDDFLIAKDKFLT